MELTNALLLAMGGLTPDGKLAERSEPVRQRTEPSRQPARWPTPAELTHALHVALGGLTPDGELA